MSLHLNINELALGSPVAMTTALRRKTKMRRTLLAAAATFLVFSTAAFAQVEQPSQVSIQGTALITKDTTSDSTSTLNRATKSGGFLLGYSYQFNNWAGVEGNYGYTRNTQNYLGSFGQSAVEANTHEVTGSFVFHIPVKAAHVRPYALAGGGALIFDPTDKFLVGGVDRQTKGAFVYGGGFNFDVARNFGIRTEYRGLVYKTPDFKLNTLTLDKVTHLAQPSVGFYFRF
jgi:opacity protein-like surface antigen